MSSDFVMPADPTDVILPFDYSSVGDLADALRESAERIRGRTFECLIDNGRDLIGGRDRLRYGQFGRWVKSECGISVRLAELSIMVAKYAEANGKCEIISRLPQTLQYLIAAPSTPEPIREHVLERYAEGQHVKVKEVKQMLRAAKDQTSQPAKRGGNGSDEPMRDGQQVYHPHASEVEARADQLTTSSADHGGNEGVGNRRISKMAETADPAALTTGKQSGELMPDGELHKEGAATVHPPTTSPPGGPGGEPQGDGATLDLPGAAAAQGLSSSYLERVIKILGEEVKQKGLLIDLFKKLGYDDLAQQLQAYDDKRVTGAA